MAHHFEYLIVNVLENPHIRLSDLPLITEYEFDQFTYAFNDTKEDYAKCKTIVELFVEQVQKNPSSVAITNDNFNLTYKELNDKANYLAKLLRNNGIVDNEVVGILIGKTPELIISILGVLKAGGCYLPLDDEFPEKRLRYIIEDSQCAVLITSSVQKSRIDQWKLNKPQGNPITIINTEELHDSTQEVVENISYRNTLDQLAYIIYTSGTTGNPKGVMIEHRSLLNYAMWASNEYVGGEICAFPLFTNTAFDLSLTSIFIPLITGNRIHIYDDQHDLAITELIKDNTVNIVKLTPSHLRILRDLDITQRSGEIQLKKLIVGGEALETELALEIYHKYNGQVEIYNEYGPTEATIGCMIHKFNPESRVSSVPIGQPISNTQAYVLDESLNPVAIGLTGELYVSGDGLARGYLFKKKLTDQKFISNPFVQGQRMYRTGDLVIRLPDGNLEYVGRIDEQVKIRGYRVELNEIANCIKDKEEIIDAIVTQKLTEHQQNLLIGYYVSKEPESNGMSHENTLKRYLSSRLPDYMIPAHFVRLDKFPLTENGKVDFNELPEPVSIIEHQAPASTFEKVSLQIWSEIFGREDLGVSDNFFDLGGDSIKAVQITSRLFEKGIEINARDILRYHTIEQIALQANTVISKNDEQGIVEGDRNFTPIELWFFEKPFKNPDYYNQSVLLNFHKPIQVEIVNQTIKTLIAHHDTLRTNFIPEQNKCFYNNKLLDEDIKVCVYDLDKRSETLEDLCTHIRNSLDITNGLLIKGGVFIDNATNYLFLTAHHLIIDGVSWRILLEDFYKVYNALADGNNPKLPSKTASMLQWENKLIKKRDKGLSATDYWNQVSKVEFVIPQDYETKENFVWSREHKGIEIDSDLTNFLLTDAHQNYKSDVLTLLTTTLALTLGSWTGLREYVVEFENHGRHLEDIDTSRTVGWFTSLYPVKLMLTDDSLSNQIMAIKEQLRAVPELSLIHI